MYVNTALLCAAYSGKLVIFPYLTQIGADINIRNGINNTALHYAAASASADIICLLLDKEMSVNLTDTDSLHCYMFQLDVAILKHRIFCGKFASLFSAKNMLLLH
jgi:ankyrin repeat protein